MRPARLAAAGLVAAAALLATSGARADQHEGLSGQAGQLRSANAALAAEGEQVLLELYALESRLARAERRLAALERRAAELARREEAAEERLALAREELGRAEAQLAERLRGLYIDGEVEPLAVLLGAESLDEAVTFLDGLGRLADQDRDIVTQLQETRATLRRAVRELARRRAETRALVAEARSARSALEQAAGERSSYLAALKRQRELNARQIAQLSAQAAASEERARELAPPAADGDAGSGPPQAGGRKMSVISTGYCLKGTTATGIPVAWGVVAVDPAVIPLGTRMFVPGYGNGVAADTGSAVRGPMVDVWFPSCGQAIRWGRRTITITIY